MPRRRPPSEAASPATATPRRSRIRRIAYDGGQVKPLAQVRFDELADRFLAYVTHERGLAENTIVVFTTDHGELLGDHGLWMKGPFHYEQMVRIPMIIRWPAGLTAGRRVSGLVSQVDIVPTVMAAARAPCEAEVDGVDAGPLLRGERETVRDHALVECVDDPHKLRLKTIITDNRKLTWYCGRAEGELYDLEQDPNEKINHWDDPQYAGEKARLLSRILDDLEPLERRVNRDCYA